MSDRLRLKSQVKNAGIYHVGLGTWTRAGATHVSLGPTFRTIYNNTCSSPFFGSIYPNETWTDEGRLPGLNSPDKLYDQNQLSVASFVGANDQCPEGPTSAPGSARGSAAVNGSYAIDAITIGYCSDEAGPLSVPAGAGAKIHIFFRDSTAIDGARCAQGPLAAPAPNASFSLVSFPGAGAGPFGCWLVALDLTGVTASFTMRADGNGNFNSSLQTTNTELAHCFSWSFSFPTIASPTTTAASGMIMAGAPADAAHGGWLTATTTGGGLTAACSGYDGTTWDHQDVSAAPVYALNGVVTNANGAEGTLLVTGLGGEPGTGMTTQDSVRVDLNPATSVNGCYFFGGPGGTNPFSSFHLKLHTLAASNVTPVSPGSGFCFGDNCAFTCPCIAPNTVPDPSGGHESGCANSNPLALSGALGATLDVSGDSCIGSGDTLRFTSTTGTVGYAFLVKGNAATSNGVFPATADGIRCVSGALVRFGGHNAGTNGDAAGKWSYPNTAQTTTVSSATAQTAGQNAQYQLFYRNPAAGWCSGATTNFSCGRRVRWRGACPCPVCPCVSTITSNPRQVVVIGQDFTLDSAGAPTPGIMAWAGGGTPANGTGLSFTTKFNSAGTHPVTATWNPTGGGFCFDAIDVHAVQVTGVTADGADLVPSQGDAGILHFVTPKAGAGQKVTLIATVTPNNVAVQAHIDWDGATEDSANPLRATVTKDAAARHVVRIKVNGQLCKELRVWVVWSTITSAAPTVATNDGLNHFSGGANIVCTHTVAPTTLFTDANRPKLDGDKTIDPPGGNHWTGDPLSGGADKKWDASRQIRTKVVNPSAIPPADIVAGLDAVAIRFFDAQPIAYPNNEVEGNDDRGTGDRTNDPYAANGAPLTSSDSPQALFSHNAGANGDTLEIRLHFCEFTRLQLPTRWVRISDNYLWRVHVKAKKANGNWGNDGTDAARDNAGF